VPNSKEKILYHAHVHISFEFAVSIYDRIDKLNAEMQGDPQAIENISKSNTAIFKEMLREDGDPLHRMMLFKIIWEHLSDMDTGEAWEEAILGNETTIEDIVAPLVERLDDAVQVEDEDFNDNAIYQSIDTHWLKTEFEISKMAGGDQH